MKEFKLIDKEVALYFATARERYRIMLRRRNGKEAPWSNDQIFNDWFFCNLFREDDKVTRWVKKWIREPNRNSPNVLWMMVACRLFNKIPTLEILVNEGLFQPHEQDQVQGEMGWRNRFIGLANHHLKDVKPLTGAAYMVHTPYGMNKLKGCLKLINDAFEYNDRMIKAITPGTTTQQEVWEMLMPEDCFGPFMSYEVVTDLKHTYLLENAPDIMTWSSPGPGACKGLSRMVGEEVSYGSAVARAAALVCMRELLERSQTDRKLWPSFWPDWDMRTAEHWLCEHSKWCRVNFKGQRMKRKYPIK